MSMPQAGVFRDRAHAGMLLGERLARRQPANTIVVALPRGGVAVAAPVASRLGVPLDIMAVRKIGHPRDSEYAIGAVDEHGTTLLAQDSGVDSAYLEAEKARCTKEAQRRGVLYRSGRAPIPLRGKRVIIVDDGIATGLTMRLAVAVAKKAGAARIIAASPVASEEAVADIEKLGAAVVVVLPPREFAGSIGAHYASFEQLDDDEVLRLLAR